MDRVRRAGTTALVFVFALLSMTSPAVGLLIPPGVALAASVAWPTSTLVVAEVQTGGTSASDEFVEIANQGTAAVDLNGLEVVYATSSGSTVTRKATWTVPTLVEPGRRVLIVNGAGAYAAAGDVVYTGGFAATGGALALRVVGGNVIDAVGWGDAVNAFVEGTAAGAPPSGSSLERRPGGALGNGTDTNDNALDLGVVAVPGPQGSSAPPVPAPGPTPSPTAPASPTATPGLTPTPSPAPTSTADPTPTPTPVATPVPSPTAGPTAGDTVANGDAQSDTDTDPGAHARTHADTDPGVHADSHARTHADHHRHRHRAVDGRWCGRHRVRRHDHGAWCLGGRTNVVHPGRDRRHRALPRCTGRRADTGRHDGAGHRRHRYALRAAHAACF